MVRFGFNIERYRVSLTVHRSFFLHGNIQMCIMVVVVRRFKAMSKQEVLLETAINSYSANRYICNIPD